MRAILGMLAPLLLAAIACGPGASEDGSAGGGAAIEMTRPEAPDFSLNDLDGATVSLADLRGKVVVLDFWATWCPPCEYQIPILNEVHAAHGEGDGDVAILGISVDTEGPEAVREYLTKHEATYPILMGSEALARRFGAPGFPSLILVDREGRIGEVHVGLIEAPELEAAIAKTAGHEAEAAEEPGGSGPPRAPRAGSRGAEERSKASPRAGTSLAWRDAVAVHLGDTDFEVRRTYERGLEAGEIIFEEGDSGEFLYVIQSGEVELTRGAAEGRRLVGRLGPGEFFGEMSVVLGGERRIRATAVTPVRLLTLDGHTLEGMCVDRPEVAIRLIQRLAARVIDLEKRLTALGSDDLLPPMVRVLVRRAEPVNEGSARFAGSLRDLATESGLTMREAHRALHLLFDQKVLRLADDVLEADDLEAISACLDAL